MDVLSSTAIIHCKKYHKVHTRAFMSESYRTLCVCKHFNIKTSKTQCFFSQKCYKFPARAVLLKSWENHGNLKNSIKSNDFMSPRGAPAMLCHAPRARILCKKYHKVHTRAFMSKSYQTHCVCKHFNIKTSKTQCFFTIVLQISCPGALAEIIGEP